uniref:N-acylglucosamine 2-epimerase n=1 Tax=Taeniopygia guttata TaxID=59729 RepID=A0A674GJT6_TAEGU
MCGTGGYLWVWGPTGGSGVPRVGQGGSCGSGVPWVGQGGSCGSGVPWVGQGVPVGLGSHGWVGGFLWVWGPRGGTGGSCGSGVSMGGSGRFLWVWGPTGRPLPSHGGAPGVAGPHRGRTGRGCGVLGAALARPRARVRAGTPKNTPGTPKTPQGPPEIPPGPPKTPPGPPKTPREPPKHLRDPRKYPRTPKTPPGPPKTPREPPKHLRDPRKYPRDLQKHPWDPQDSPRTPQVPPTAPRGVPSSGTPHFPPNSSQLSAKDEPRTPQIPTGNTQDPLNEFRDPQVPLGPPNLPPNFPPRGFFSCLSRDGSVYDDTKFVWLQGRQIWVYSRLYRTVPRFRRPELLQAARKAGEFLESHVRPEPGSSRAAFALRRDGRPERLQRSFYSEAFCALGLDELGRAAGEERYRVSPLPKLPGTPPQITLGPLPKLPWDRLRPLPKFPWDRVSPLPKLPGTG